MTQTLDEVIDRLNPDREPPFRYTGSLRVSDVEADLRAIIHELKQQRAKLDRVRDELTGGIDDPDMQLWADGLLEALDKEEA